MRVEFVEMLLYIWPNCVPEMALRGATATTTIAAAAFSRMR